MILLDLSVELVSSILQCLSPRDLGRMHIVSTYFSNTQMNYNGCADSSIVEDVARSMLRRKCSTQLLPIFTNAPVQAYNDFMNGPQATTLWPHLIGNGVHWAQDSSGVENAGLVRCSIARSRNGITYSSKVMNSGVHFISFKILSAPGTICYYHQWRTLTNAIGFGIMRPISISVERLRRNNSNSRFPLFSSRNVRFMNQSRTESWRGNVDLALYTPGYRETVSSDWRGLKKRNTESCQWSSGQTLGLLLDLDAGNLLLFCDNEFVGEVINGLDGDYVWMIYSRGSRTPGLHNTDYIEDMVVQAKQY